MQRLMLTDELWSKLRIIMNQFDIYDKPNLRMMVEGINLSCVFTSQSIIAKCQQALIIYALNIF